MVFAVDPALVKASASVASTAWKNRNAIQQLVSAISRLFNEGRSDVIVFGAGGVGKTRLAARLSGKASDGKPSPPYKYDITLKNVKWPDRFGKISVVPGQAERHDVWSQQLQSVHRRKGIINVVSSGMHTPVQDSYRDHPLYKKGMNKEEFLSVYIPHCKKMEMDFLRELCPYLRGMSKPFWVLTLVNKQDLWWKNRLEVEDYYLNGEYGEIIGEARDKSIYKFQHEIVSAAIESENWTTKSGEILKEVEAGYDARARWINLSNLKIVVEELLSREV